MKEETEKKKKKGISKKSIFWWAVGTVLTFAAGAEWGSRKPETVRKAENKVKNGMSTVGNKIKGLANRQPKIETGVNTTVPPVQVVKPANYNNGGNMGGNNVRPVKKF